MLPLARRRAPSSAPSASSSAVMSMSAVTRRAPRRILALAATCTLALGLAACASEPSTASPSPTAAASSSAPSPSPTPSPTPATAMQPLRGTEVLADTITGPALSAKIDNHVGARPQVGLQSTDLVFEELVEGGLTRYVAVWFSDVPAEIGPVRSIRPMDPDIITPLGGIVAYSGGQERFVAMMQNTPVHNAIHGGTDDRFMYRTKSKAAPHNVLVKAPELRAAYADIPPPAPQFSYSLLPQTASAAAYGVPSAGLDVAFSRGESRQWRWDAASATYLRSQNGAVDVDSTGAQLAATNVVAINVGVDWTYGIIPRTVMVGSGTAWIATGGSVVEATWTKASREAPIQLTNRHGVPIYLAPGNAWIELVPGSDGGSVAVG